MLVHGGWRSRYHCYRHSAAQKGQNVSPPYLISSVFDLYKHDVPQIKSQTMGHALMDLVNTTLFKKYVDP